MPADENVRLRAHADSDGRGRAQVDAGAAAEAQAGVDLGADVEVGVDLRDLDLAARTWRPRGPARPLRRSNLASA